MSQIAQQHKQHFLELKAGSAFSAGERLATQLLVRVLQRRILYKGLKRGVLPHTLWRRFSVSHMRGSTRMKEVQVCEVLLRALRHLVHVPGGAHVDKDVWDRVPNDYELEWD